MKSTTYMASFPRRAFDAAALAVALFAFLLVAGGVAWAAEYKGWEQGSAYDKLYVASERDRVKGTVQDVVTASPMTGMAEGVALVVKDKADGKAVTVQLGPKDFVDLKGIDLKKGDEVRVYGVWATVGGKEVFLANKVKKGESQELKFRRTKDGKAYWNMSEEERKTEQAGASGE